MPKEVEPIFIRTVIPISLSGANLSGTGALTIIDQMALGFRYFVESVICQTTIALVGAGGTQTYKLRKGGATGTVVATMTPTVADHGTLGTQYKVAASTTGDVARFIDSDKLSLTREASGTTITAGQLDMYIVLRQRPQARV